jgi:hypothetical protein
MNRKLAYTILGIQYMNTSISDNIIKKHYHIKALQYHPDKNKDPDAVSKFQEIQDAYEFLMGNSCNSTYTSSGENNTYKNILQVFLKSIWKKDTDNTVFSVVIEKMTECCETKVVELLEQMDNQSLIKIHEIFSKYKSIFHFSEGVMACIEQVLSNKIKKGNCIILNPTIDDLFECNLYKITENDLTYIIPLWHHELVYDNNGNDLYVKCQPTLPDNISIDAENNIHVCVKYDILDIFSHEIIDICIGSRKFSIFKEQLRLKQTQTITLKTRGIPKIHNEDIYNISKKSNIYIYIELVHTP